MRKARRNPSEHPLSRDDRSGRCIEPSAGAVMRKMIRPAALRNSVKPMGWSGRNTWEEWGATHIWKFLNRLIAPLVLIKCASGGIEFVLFWQIKKILIKRSTIRRFILVSIVLVCCKCFNPVNKTLARPWIVCVNQQVQDFLQQWSYIFNSLEALIIFAHRYF